MGMVRNGWGRIDHGSRKCLSHKWFDDLSRLIKWFLHADSDGIVFYSYLYLWHLNAEGPLQLHLARVLGKVAFVQKWPHTRVFLLIWKILLLIFAENKLK